jgi:hypothetical protein
MRGGVAGVVVNGLSFGKTLVASPCRNGGQCVALALCVLRQRQNESAHGIDRHIAKCKQSFRAAGPRGNFISAASATCPGRPRCRNRCHTTKYIRPVAVTWNKDGGGT